MASSSSSIKRYHVFLSFHGPDVRRGFLSHVHSHFATKGITTFNDQEMERGNTIGPELVQAIRESRVLILVLSKKYASSSWCLDELVEILKCKEAPGQSVMTIFYDVDPSDVRKQRGDFGSTFMKTCLGKAESEKKRWIEALAYVATIAGEHSLNWEDEAKMIEKIATDVSNKLNITPSKDFDGMVGMEAHLRNVNSYLHLDCDEVKMIGILGPAGIGKTTIARALFDQLSIDFQLKCFMGNLKGSYGSVGIDDHDSKLCLQSQLLSKILNQKDMKVHHLGAIKERLQDQRVLIVLDDVDDLEQLDTLAKEPTWFGLGSRIVVTTKDRKIMKAHWIKDIYHVGYPSEEEALKILCLYAFKQSSPRGGFEEFAKKIAYLCGNLPLGLRVVGSSLRGETEEEWALQLSKLETSLDRKIEDILRVGYDKLSKKHQSLFLHIAFFFSGHTIDYVTTMLAGCNLDVKNGLKNLADKSLVDVSTNGWITMHCLLRQLGRQVVYEQSDEPGKRQFLVEAEEIHNVMANETGTGSVVGISFDMSKISDFSVSGQAFEGMRNLRFLRINGGCLFKFSTQEMEYLPRLKLLHWSSYPGKCLPPRFQAECLIELIMPASKLERLWQGIQPLPNLKKINLQFSFNLKEIPNLSNAIKLETLKLTGCRKLRELHSSIRNPLKLWIPREEVDMSYSSRSRTFLDISMNIKKLNVLPSIVERLPLLQRLQIGSRNLETLLYIPLSLRSLDLSHTNIERIPDFVIGLPQLESLFVDDCRKLVSLSGLPPLLASIHARDCVSLKRVCFSFQYPMRELLLHNCFKLDEEARRAIMQQRVCNYKCLPGNEIPAEFTEKATGHLIIIPSVLVDEESFSEFARIRYKVCLLLPPTSMEAPVITCLVKNRAGVTITKRRWTTEGYFSSLTKHLFMCDLIRARPNVYGIASEIMFEFSWGNSLLKGEIIECGVQILCEEVESGSGCEWELDYFKTEAAATTKQMKMKTIKLGQQQPPKMTMKTMKLKATATTKHMEMIEDYETEVVQISQCEEVKSSKYKYGWSWLKKIWSGEENDDEEEDRTSLIQR